MSRQSMSRALDRFKHLCVAEQRRLSSAGGELLGVYAAARRQARGQDWTCGIYRLILISMCIYMYIYVCVYIQTYIYIYTSLDEFDHDFTATEPWKSLGRFKGSHFYGRIYPENPKVLVGDTAKTPRHGSFLYSAGVRRLEIG